MEKSFGDDRGTPTAQIGGKNGLLDRGFIPDPDERIIALKNDTCACLREGRPFADPQANGAMTLCRGHLLEIKPPKTTQRPTQYPLYSPPGFCDRCDPIGMLFNPSWRGQPPLKAAEEVWGWYFHLNFLILMEL